MTTETLWAQMPFPCSKEIPGPSAPQLRTLPSLPLVAGLASLADSHGGCTSKEMRGGLIRGCQSHRGCQSLHPFPLSLMCLHQRHEPHWASVFPKMRWGFPPKNPYRAMDRGAQEAASEMGKWEPRYSLDGTVPCPIVTQKIVTMPVPIQQVWGKGPRFCISSKFLVMLLLVHGPHFEKQACRCS